MPCQPIEHILIGKGKFSAAAEGARPREQIALPQCGQRKQHHARVHIARVYEKLAEKIARRRKFPPRKIKLIQGRDVRQRHRVGVEIQKAIRQLRQAVNEQAQKRIRRIAGRGVGTSRQSLAIERAAVVQHDAALAVHLLQLALQKHRLLFRDGGEARIGVGQIHREDVHPKRRFAVRRHRQKRQKHAGKHGTVAAIEQ